MKNSLMYSPHTPLKSSRLYFIVNSDDTFPPDHPHFDEPEDGSYYDAEIYDMAVSVRQNDSSQKTPRKSATNSSDHNYYL